MDLTAKIIITIALFTGILWTSFFMLGLFVKKEKYKEIFAVLTIIFFVIFWIITFIAFFIAIWRF